MQVTKDSIIGDVLDFAPDTAQFFFEIGSNFENVFENDRLTIKVENIVVGASFETVNKVVSHLNKTVTESLEALNWLNRAV